MNLYSVFDAVSRMALGQVLACDEQDAQTIAQRRWFFTDVYVTRGCTSGLK